MKAQSIYLSQFTLSESDTGPLSDKTFVVKDFTQVQGHPLTFGLKSPLIKVALEHSAIIKSLLKAGATLKGITNLDVAALGYAGTNPYYATNLTQPAKDMAIPGSTFGAAAAVKKGDVDFGIGSDLAGSTRLPAAACKLWGIKLSPETAQREGSIFYDAHLDCFGILARELPILRDVSALFSETDKPTTVKNVHIPSVTDLSCLPESAKNNFLNLCKIFTERGLNVLELPKDYFTHSFSIKNTVYPRPISKTLERLNIDDPAIADLKTSLKMLCEQESNGLQQAKLNEELTEILKESIIISPTLPGSSDPAHPSLNFYSLLANIAGCPALTTPWTDDGIQLIGARGSDLALIDSASKLNE